jgi:hypothetical protein
MSMDGYRSTLDSVVKPGVSKPKKKQKVKPQTRKEVEGQLKKLDETEGRLTKEAAKTQAELSRLQENYEKEHVEGQSARRSALDTVKDTDKSALDSVQQVKSDVHIQKVIGSTKKYLGDLQGEIKLGRMKKDRLNKELKDISRVELAEEVAELAKTFFVDAANLDAQYKAFESKAAELRATGAGWDKIIDKMVKPFIKVCIDSTIPNSPTLIDFLVQVQSVSGPYAADNPMSRDYADMQHPPHKHLRLQRDNYGVNERGHMADGGVKMGT